MSAAVLGPGTFVPSAIVASPMCSETERVQLEVRRAVVVGLRDGLDMDTAQVAEPRAAVIPGIGVQQLPPPSRQGHADAILVPRDGRQVQNADHRMLAFRVETRKGE